MHMILDITEAQARTIIAATAFLSDDDPLKLSIVTAIAFARRLQLLETPSIPENIHAIRPGHYTVTRED